MSFALPPGLADEVLDRLGVPAPADLDAMARLARAWVAQVPFTNLAKVEAARRGEPSPEADGALLCRRWLEAGRGGTCWSHVAALAGLARHGGLEATASLERALWRVPPDEIDFHGGVVLHGDGARWLVDPVHCSDELLCLEPGARGRAGPLEVGVEQGPDGALEHWFQRRGTDESSVYRVLSTLLDEVDVAAFVRVAETHTGVGPGRLIWRLAPPGAKVGVKLADDGDGWRCITQTVDETSEAHVETAAEAFALAGAREPELLGSLVDELWPDGGAT